MARKILKSSIHTNERKRATALLAFIPFILPLVGLLFGLMTQGAAGYSAPPSPEGALQTEGHLQEPEFDLHIHKTDGLSHVLPGSLITYTIYFSMTLGTTQTFHLIDHPPAYVSTNDPGWAPIGGGDWQYPATDVITLTSGESLSTTFTVSVPFTVPHGTQLENRISFDLDQTKDATPEDNVDIDTTVLFPGFHLPLIMKNYAP